MMETKFTEVTARKCGCGHPGCDQYILSTQRSAGFDKADAVLYAAAPDLYAAGQAIIDQCDAMLLPDDGKTATLRAALAKARGDQP